MKIKQSLVLRQVAQNWVVIPVAESTLDFSGILTLNDSGAMLWNILKEESDRNSLVEALTGRYNVSVEIATADVDIFLKKLKEAGCFEE